MLHFSEIICVCLVRKLEILGYILQKEFQEYLSVLLFFIIFIFLSFLPFKICFYVGKSRVQVIWLSVTFLRLSWTSWTIFLKIFVQQTILEDRDSTCLPLPIIRDLGSLNSGFLSICHIHWCYLIFFELPVGAGVWEIDTNLRFDYCQCCD